MRVFHMKQDTALPYTIRLRDFDLKHGHRTFELDQAGELKDTTILYLEGNGDEICPDYLEHPVYMISEKAGDILSLYEDDLVLKKVCLLHKEARREEKMYHLLAGRIPAIHADTRFYPDGRPVKLILSREAIGDHHAFWLEGKKKEGLFVTLPVVESLLRRQVQGILFEEMEVR